MSIESWFCRSLNLLMVIRGISKAQSYGGETLLKDVQRTNPLVYGVFGLGH